MLYPQSRNGLLIHVSLTESYDREKRGAEGVRADKETLAVLGEARECNHDLIPALKDRLNV